jgi:dihydroneopterin triphosphate diphosphatase
MARAPFQVLIYPYRKTNDGRFEYALLKRVDDGLWQAITGGGEDQETPLEAARRETEEETGIPSTSPIFQLDSIESVPVIEFRNSTIWGEDVYVIPQHCFGVDAGNAQIMISREHTEFRWVSFDEAHQLLNFTGDMTALWELDKRLRGKGPRG